MGTALSLFFLGLEILKPFVLGLGFLLLKFGKVLAYGLVLNTEVDISAFDFLEFHSHLLTFFLELVLQISDLLFESVLLALD